MIPVQEERTLANPLLETIGEDVMGFLNEIQLQYPNAISLASGRPDDRFFHLDDFSEYVNIYVDAMCTAENISREKALAALGQYGRTKGFINNEVARYLLKDEMIKVKPEDIVMTVGAQEAMTLAVITLCNREKDVILVEDPTYVGITHFSIITGYAIDTVPVKDNGMSIPLLEEKIRYYRSIGKNVKLVYVIADYQNPSGNSMSLENRKKLLELARHYQFFILEDNAYGEFCYEGEKPLSLKALDSSDRVIYLRSFSKTLYPQLRLGALVAGQKLREGGKETALADLIAKTKGYITVNTPSLNQAILGGILIKNNFSLKEVNKEKVDAMKHKRDLLLHALDKFLKACPQPWSTDIRWNRPHGGFFATIHVPFKVSKQDVIFCAEQFGVIFTPMSFFYLKEGGDHEIRIAFSNLSDETIETAIERLVNYFQYKINPIH